MKHLFSGKRTFRILVNCDPDMAETIKHRAERQLRSVGSEIVHLLTTGIVNDSEANVYDAFRVNAEGCAPPRKVTHGSAQQRRTA